MIAAKHVVPVLCLAMFAAGCGKETYHQTQKKEALKRWDESRAKMMFRLAERQFEAGEFAKSKESLSNALATEADLFDVHLLMGRILSEEGKLNEAKRHLEVAEELNPDSPESYYYQGIIHQRWNEWPEALAMYETALDIDDINESYLLAVVDCLIAIDQSGEALGLVESKLPRFSHSAGLRVAAAEILIGDQQYGLAKEYYGEALGLAPESSSVRQGMALAAYWAGDYATAYPLLKQLTDADDPPPTAVFTALGECHLRIGNPIGARHCFEVVTQRDPADPHAWVNLGKVALVSDDLNRAQWAGRRAMGLAPDSIDARMLLGYVAHKQKRYSDAIQIFADVMERSNRDPLIYCLIGQSYEAGGDTQQATRFYDRALQLDPEHPLARELLATAGNQP